MDCLHLLTLHEPGHEFHVVPELSVPGGSVDYILASVVEGRVIDFAGIELQAVDTTGTIWPERQRLVAEMGIRVPKEDVENRRPFGINWKMSAKTTLVQLHHKIVTFQAIGRRLVLAVQNPLFEYMQREFDFSIVAKSRLGDPMQFHVYDVVENAKAWSIRLSGRWSTDAAGIAKCLGLKADPKVELHRIAKNIEQKISPATLWAV